MSRYKKLKVEDRLACTIDGEPVCEVDIKASYLFLASRLTEWNRYLGDDPYQAIEFVREGSPRMRDLAKRLVSAMISNPVAVTKFPKGEKKDESGQIVPVREEFGLPKNADVSLYTRQILDAFPFLDKVGGQAGTLMYLESTIMVSTMLDLSRKVAPISSYPIHDCLLCKQSDASEVVKELQKSMMDRVGAIPCMDIEYPDGHTEVLKGEVGSVSDPYLSRGENIPLISDDDFEVVEDF